MNVILISGKSGHGKDTCAGFLESFLRENGKSVLIIHYADLLKFICEKYFSWDGKKDEAGRTLLQTVGTDIIRDRRPGYFVEFVCEFIQMFSDSWDYAIVPDVRFENELAFPMFVYDFKTLHIHVERPNYTNELTEEQNNHISENALNDVFDFDPEPYRDVLIMNDGTLEELKDKTIKLFKEQHFDEFNQERHLHNNS